jgi:hypothetical protein
MRTGLFYSVIHKGWKLMLVYSPPTRDGRMSLVPEGQHDRSQARSAWVAMKSSPVPGDG